MKIFFGSDHAGFDLKIEVMSILKQKEDFELIDCGCFSGVDPVDYPDIAYKTCEEVLRFKGRAVLFCGTGVGMAMAANRVRGIRAVCATDYYSVKCSRLHNDANVLCLGGRVVGPHLAMELVDVFLKTDFEGGRHVRRLDKF